MADKVGILASFSNTIAFLIDKKETEVQKG